jgi:putative two-component system protein, hydrogenase maturation factor HypX/HoxX
MNILFITTAHNSLSQRLYIELNDAGHNVSVVLATDHLAMLSAVARVNPGLIIAPMLKTAIPEVIWRKHTCLIVHPGIMGDRGPSSLDWAISQGQTRWGVTVLQADAEMDAGAIWASCEFAMPEHSCTKSSLYRNEVTKAAVSAVLAAVQHFQSGNFTPQALDYSNKNVRGRLRPSIKQSDRAINWKQDTTAEIVRKIRAADSCPGVLDTQFGVPCFLFGAHEEDQLKGPCGEILAVRDGAICVGTVDGAIWITHLKGRSDWTIKLPATQVLGQRVAHVAHSTIDLRTAVDYRTWHELYYVECDQVGYLYFNFYNGAMSTQQCRRLRDAYLEARARPTKVIVLMGGCDFFSNGIHLNTIEAAENPAIESWHNILAIDDLVVEIINTMSHLTVAALRGNAGAGGAMLALAADRIYAREGVVLNPHYKTMGGLYGSEYWTYSLPRRMGQAMARELTEACQPLGVQKAKTISFIDDAFGADTQLFERELISRCEAMAADPAFWNQLKAKHAKRLAEERAMPLASYRQKELAQMHVNFFGDDPAYHQARWRFVHKQNPASQNQSIQPLRKVGDS